MCFPLSHSPSPGPNSLIQLPSAPEGIYTCEPWLRYYPASSKTLISLREISAPLYFHVKKADYYDKLVSVELNVH